MGIWGKIKKKGKRAAKGALSGGFSELQRAGEKRGGKLGTAAETAGRIFSSAASGATTDLVESVEKGYEQGGTGGFVRGASGVITTLAGTPGVIEHADTVGGERVRKIATGELAGEDFGLIEKDSAGSLGALGFKRTNAPKAPELTQDYTREFDLRAQNAQNRGAPVMDSANIKTMQKAVSPQMRRTALIGSQRLDDPERLRAQRAGAASARDVNLAAARLGTATTYGGPHMGAATQIGQRTNRPTSLARREGMDATTLDASREGEMREAQLQALGSARARATGEAPSAAELQLKQGQEQALRNALAVAADARGGNVGLARRQAMETGNQAALEANQQAAMLRAQEQERGEARFAELAGQAREMDIGTASTQAQLDAQRAAQLSAQGQEVGLTNQQQINQMALDRDRLTQQGLMFDADARNKQALAMAQMQNQAGMQGASLDTDVSMQNAAMRNERNALQANLAQQNQQFNAGLLQERGLAGAQAQNQMNMQTQSLAAQLAQQEAAMHLAAGQSNQAMQSRESLQEFDTRGKINMYNTGQYNQAAIQQAMLDQGANQANLGAALQQAEMNDAMTQYYGNQGFSRDAALQDLALRAYGQDSQNWATGQALDFDIARANAALANQDAATRLSTFGSIMGAYGSGMFSNIGKGQGQQPAGEPSWEDYYDHEKQPLGPDEHRL